MKIALCLHGIASGFNDSGVPVSFGEGVESIKENILNKYDVDVFYHTWSKDAEENLNKDYKPKKYTVEEQIKFSHPFSAGSTQYSFTPEIQTKLQSIYSRWYSFMKSIELKKEFEKENDIEYDFVMSSRFDIVYYTPFIKFENLDPTKFYVSNWWHNRFNFGYNDTWFLTGSNQMDRVGEIYSQLDTFLAEGSDYEKNLMSLKEISPRENPHIDAKISNHGLLRWHTKSMAIETGFIGLEYESWSLVRKVMHGRVDPSFSRGFPLPLDVPISEERGSSVLDGPRGVGW